MRKKFGINHISLMTFMIISILVSISEKVTAQSYTYTIRNDMQTSDRTMEFDLYLLNTNPDIPIEISVAQAGIIVNSALVNGGTITASFVSGASGMVAAQVPTSITYASATSCIKIAAKSIPGCGSGTVLSTTGLGTRFCRVKLTNTVPFGVAKANLAFNFTASPYNTFIGKFRADCTGSDALPIDAAIGFSAAYNHTLNAPVTPLTITGVTAGSKVYDGSASAILSGGALSGVLGSDEVTIVAGTGTFSDKNVETSKTVTATGYSLSGRDVQYYSLSAQPSGMTADITAKGLTISGVVADNKTYDGTTDATLNSGSLEGIVNLDEVTITNGTGSFSDKNIGESKTVTATGYSITGAGAANYILSAQPTVANADITAASITITGVTASNKVYDGLLTATLNGGSVTGKIGTEIVTIVAGSGTFANKNVGESKAVTATGYSLAGADVANYTLSAQPIVASANITVASLTITGVLVTTKTYDATTAATLTGGSLVGVISPDVVSLVSGTGSFGDINVGKLKAVTATGYSITGADVANYVLSGQPTGLTGEIKPSPLTVKVLLEGVWNSTNLNMDQCKIDDGVTAKFGGTVVDTISIELHDATNYATIIYRASNLELNQDGSITSAGLSYITIPEEFNGNYRITVKHRNHLETTTASAVSFATEPSYDFTTAANKSYGSNLALYNGKYLVYSGDIVGAENKQDGVVDGLDAIEIDNEITAFAAGYLKVDINGDGVVDGLDAIFVNNNMTNFISIILP